MAVSYVERDEKNLDLLSQDTRCADLCQWDVLADWRQERLAIRLGSEVDLGAQGRVMGIVCVGSGESILIHVNCTNVTLFSSLTLASGGRPQCQWNGLTSHLLLAYSRYMLVGSISLVFAYLWHTKVPDNTLCEVST